MRVDELRGEWALVLGASSGFGAAIALELAGHGMNILGVHLDRRSTLSQVENLVDRLRQTGVDVEFFNVNAADPDRREETLDAIRERVAPSRVRTVVHSLAFGSLKALVGPSAKESLTKAQIEMTLDVMASSLVYWVQGLVWRDLLGEGGRVLAMTSAGDQRCWPEYGAVSAAKAALEAYVRQLAFELGPRRITVNAIRAGVTDTPAARKIPGHEKMFEEVRRRNPGGRMTTPEDVASVVALLSLGASGWMSGGVIGVDGGEDVVG